MSAKILYGKHFATKIKEEIKQEENELRKKYGIIPGLAVIMVGNDPASQIYVRNKHNACIELGFYSKEIVLPYNISYNKLLSQIDLLNNDDKIHGILVQLPLPEHLQQYESKILNYINPLKDVDGFHPINVGKLSIGEESLTPCTPTGCIHMLKLANIDIAGKHAVIVGRSNIVGKPIANLLLAENATVTVCHSHTKNLANITRQADILVVAIGRPKFITKNMVKPGAVVIDVGINRIEPKKIVGDVDFDEIKQIASAITPVPGGVGLLTIATLMENTITAAKLQLKNKS